MVTMTQNNIVSGVTKQEITQTRLKYFFVKPIFRRSATISFVAHDMRTSFCIHGLLLDICRKGLQTFCPLYNFASKDYLCPVFYVQTRHFCGVHSVKIVFAQSTFLGSMFMAISIHVMDYRNYFHLINYLLKFTAITIVNKHILLK